MQQRSLIQFQSELFILFQINFNQGKFNESRKFFSRCFNERFITFFFINKGIVYDIYNTYLLSNAIRSRLFKVTGKND